MNPTNAERMHSDFLERVQAQYPGFFIPYIALLPGGGLIIPAEPMLLMHQVRRDGVVNGSGNSFQATHTDLSLDEFIEMHKIGDGTLFTGMKTPITAVVEFSPEGMYPDVMKKLAQKYEIRRITV